MEQKGILIVVSGFSGAGKGTLMKGLLKKYDNYGRIDIRIIYKTITRRKILC